MGTYSFISNCDDCKLNYLNWLCSTTLPRCTDVPDEFDSSTTTGIDLTNTTEWIIPTSYQQTLLRNNPQISRSPLLSPSLISTTFQNSTTITNQTITLTTLLQSPFPYSEIPPCLSLCSLVSATCPNMIQWGCPVVGGTGTAGYGVFQDVVIGGREAGDVHSLSLEEDKRGRGRAGDRWGGVL